MILLILILIGSVILGLFLVDYSLIGFVPKAMGMWSPLAELDTKDFLLVDTTPSASIRTNIKTPSGKDVIFDRNEHKTTLTVLLTKKYFIIKNTRLTYLLALENKLIGSFNFKKHIFRETIILNLIIDNEKNFFGSVLRMKNFGVKNYLELD